MRYSINRIIPLFVYLVSLIITNNYLSAAEYYVSPNGGERSGTINEPWNLNYANSQLRAGDIAFLRGGTYTHTDDVNNIIAPVNSGTSESNRITYKAYKNEVPKFRSTKRGSIEQLIVLTGKSYITVDGISADGLGIYKDSKYKSWAKFSGTKHCIIKNSTFTRSRGYSAISIRDGSNYNKILNNSFEYNGAWDVLKWDGVHDDSGSFVWIYPDNNYNLIQGNKFSKSGHDLNKIQGSYNIIRNNEYDNFWEIYDGPDFKYKFGDVRDGDRVGNRSLVISRGSRNLIEHNVFKRTPESVDNEHMAIIKLGGKDQIIRKNYFMNSVHTGIYGLTSDDSPTLINNKIYNNTFYKLGGPAFVFQRFKKNDGSGDYYAEPKNNILKNNVVYKTHEKPKDYTKYDSEVYFKDFRGKDGDDSFLDNEFSHNCVASDENATNQQANAQGPSLQTLTYYQNTRGDYFFDNIQKNPKFIRDNPENHTHLALRNDSPCIDEAGDLTTTRSSGSGRYIYVNDAKYFFDGYGVVSGDIIMVGNYPNQHKVEIKDVDYSNNKITVDRSISWSSGVGVNLAVSDLLPDMGAAEFGTSCSPQPTELTATTVSASKISLSWLAPNNCSDVSGYKIYRNGSVIASTSANPIYDDNGLSEDSTYTYTVTSITSNSNESSHSNSATARTLKDSTTTTEPTPPGTSTSISQIIDGNDDAEERASTGKVSITSSDLELGKDGSYRQTIGIRFRNNMIPRNATIVSAYLEFKVDEKSSTATNIFIQGEASGNATTFNTSLNNITNRSVTNTIVNWSNIPAWTVYGSAQRSPDIREIIQEIVSKSSWSSGNAIALFVYGDGHRVARSYDGNKSGAPKLIINYSTASGTPPSSPENLKAIAATDSQSIRLTWNASTDEDGDLGGYKIYRDGQNIKTTSNRSYTDQNLQSAKYYEYSIVAYDDAGNNSGFSQPAGATTSGSSPSPSPSPSPSGTTIITNQITSDSDDAEEFNSSGKVSLTSSDLELGKDGSDKQRIGLRFRNNKIPKNATIVRAHLEFRVDEKSSTTTNITIQGEANANSAAFKTSLNNISSRKTTNSNIVWNEIPAWTTLSSTQQSPDIREIIQEIVNQSNWTSGNSLAIFIHGDGHRVAESYRGSASGAAKLIVEYNSSEDESPEAPSETDPEPETPTETNPEPEPPTETDNLIKNSGFEDGGTGWNVKNGSIQTNTSFVYSGLKSLEIIGEANSWKGVSQKIAISEGTSYRFSGWLKIRNLSRGNFFFEVRWYSESGSELGSKRQNFGKTTSNTNYIKRQIDITAPAGATSVKFNLQANETNGIGNYDEISIIPLN